MTSVLSQSPSNTIDNGISNLKLESDNNQKNEIPSTVTTPSESESSSSTSSPSTDTKENEITITSTPVLSSSSTNTNVNEVSSIAPNAPSEVILRPSPARADLVAPAVFDSSIGRDKRGGYENDPNTGYYDEIEIEDMEYDENTRIYTYPCPCGDKFVISRDQLLEGDDIGKCPSCSLLIKVIYELEELLDEEDDD